MMAMALNGEKDRIATHELHEQHSAQKNKSAIAQGLGDAETAPLLDAKGTNLRAGLPSVSAAAATTGLSAGGASALDKLLGRGASSSAGPASTLSLRETTTAVPRIAGQAPASAQSKLPSHSGSDYGGKGPPAALSKPPSHSGSDYGGKGPSAALSKPPSHSGSDHGSNMGSAHAFGTPNKAKLKESLSSHVPAIHDAEKHLSSLKGSLSSHVSALASTIPSKSKSLF